MEKGDWIKINSMERLRYFGSDLEIEDFPIDYNKFLQYEDEGNINFEVKSDSNQKDSEIIGSVIINIGVVMDSENNTNVSFPFSNNSKRTGNFTIVKIENRSDYSFIDYIVNGCNLSLYFAIDFSKSNKIPTDPTSLHSNIKGTKSANVYAKAIKAIGSILQYYDSDNKIACLGFGAQIPPITQYISQCFAINGNILRPEVTGASNVIKEYYNVLKLITFSGPSILTEIVKFIRNICECENITQQKYLNQ